jgi:hypothetical protein
MNNLITLFREWLEERKYPEDIKKLIQHKRDRIRHHKKKLKRINKLLNGKHPLGSTRHAAKTHKYMINKLLREIEGIKNHYESNKLKK